VLWILWTTLVLAAQSTYVSGYGLCTTPCVQGCGLWISDHPQALSTGYPPAIHRVRPPSGDNSFRARLTFCERSDHSSNVSTPRPHVLPRGYPQTVDDACVQRVAVSLLVSGRSPTVSKSWHNRSYPQVLWTKSVYNLDKPHGGICAQVVDSLGMSLWTSYVHKRLDPRSEACGNSG
jgi:hypothetical protein